MTPAQTLLLIFLVLQIGCQAESLNPAVASLGKRSSSISSTQDSPAPTHEEAEEEFAQVRYTARKVIAPETALRIPKVLLSTGHAKLCKVNVGEPFPALSLSHLGLPQLGLPQLGKQTTELASLLGKQATVVLFWNPDRWMARTALIDMQRDVADQFDAKQVAVVGIPVRQPAGKVRNALKKAQATFPQLLDTDGKAFTSVGTIALPRIFVLDPAGTIVWFDIEYSEGTRRELEQTLGVLTQVQ